MARNIFKEYVDPNKQEFIIPYKCEGIGDDVFSHCRDLEKLYIPWYVKEEIPDNNFVDRKRGPFWHHHQMNLIICGEIGTEAERCAKRARIRFCATTMWIKDNKLKAYFGWSNEVKKFPKGIDTILHNAFQYAPQVVSVEIPNTVKYIESEAFMECELKEVRIPFGVIGFGSRVFKNCKNLQCVVFENGDTKLDDDCFLGCSDTLVVKAPSGGYVEKYAQKYQVKFESI